MGSVTASPRELPQGVLAFPDAHRLLDLYSPWQRAREDAEGVLVARLDQEQPDPLAQGGFGDEGQLAALGERDQVAVVGEADRFDLRSHASLPDCSLAVGGRVEQA